MREFLVGLIFGSMTFLRLVAVVFLFSAPGFGRQASESSLKTLDRFIQSKVFYEQLTVGKQIAALRDPTLLKALEPLLVTEDRHVLGNVAFVFAALGDARGIKTLVDILQDRSIRPEGQGVPIAPWSLTVQILADRYYAVHLLGEFKDARTTPILIPILKDAEVGYKAAWAIAQSGDRAAIPPLIEALGSSKANVRVIAIQSLDQLQATEAIEPLRALLHDALVTVAEAARAAIANLEEKK